MNLVGAVCVMLVFSGLVLGCESSYETKPTTGEGGSSGIGGIPLEGSGGTGGASQGGEGGELSPGGDGGFGGNGSKGLIGFSADATELYGEITVTIDDAVPNGHSESPPCDPENFRTFEGRVGLHTFTAVSSRGFEWGPSELEIEVACPSVRLSIENLSSSVLGFAVDAPTPLPLAVLSGGELVGILDEYFLREPIEGIGWEDLRYRQRVLELAKLGHVLLVPVGAGSQRITFEFKGKEIGGVEIPAGTPRGGIGIEVYTFQ